MLICDHTYYIREITLAQLSDPAVHENFILFSEKYQREFLRYVFGLPLAVQIEEELEKPEDEQDPIIMTLINGIEHEGKEWIGLRNDAKLSPLANYIFYHIVQDGITDQTGVGEVSGKPENATKVSVDDRAVWAWNEMVKWLYGLWWFIDASKLYPTCRPFLPYFEIKNTFNL